MRKTEFVEGEYYHLYGRGVNKQHIFLDERDFTRFVFLCLYFQSPHNVRNISRQVSRFLRFGDFRTQGETLQKILQDRYVELVVFTLMPNHFHLIVGEVIESGISFYMHKVLMAYAKYFNEKYEHSGHVFQGPYQAVHIGDDAQLKYVSAYIHRNQREIRKWRERELKYAWSSYQDYVVENRWSELLKRDIVLEEFGDGKSYQRFVETSGAKENLEGEHIL